MPIYSIVYTCPGSGSRRTDKFDNHKVFVRHGVLIVTDGDLVEEMVLPPGLWFSVRRLPEEKFKRPTFNHTRADGPFDPCIECLANMSQKDLIALVQDLRACLRDANLGDKP